MTGPGAAVNEGSEATLGEVYWDAYSGNPLQWKHLGEETRAAAECGAQAVKAALLAAIDARQPPPAPGDASGLLEPLHALAAKWDATAARNQRNGQSLVDQGDEYGSEGLAIAEALGACVVDLRAVLARAYRDGGLTVPEELRRYL